MPQLGGFIGGYIEGEQAKQTAAINQQNIQLNDQKLSSAAFEQKSKEALATAFKNATPEMMAEGDPVKALLKGAEIAGSVGAHDEMSELLSSAATAGRERALMEKAQLETSLQSSNIAASLLENINSGEELEAMFERVTVQGIDTKGAIPKMYKYYQDNGRKWDQHLQEAVKAGRKAVVMEEEKAKIKLAESRVNTELARQRMLNAQATVLIPAQARAAETRTAATTKAGGVTTKTTKANAELAQSLIESDYQITDTYGEDDEAAINVLTSSVVNRAADILQATPSMKADDAVKAAYRQLKNEQAFAGYLPQERRPGSVYAPLAIPATKEEMVIGNVYQGTGKYKGQPVTWTENGFELISRGGR